MWAWSDEAQGKTIGGRSTVTSATFLKHLRITLDSNNESGLDDQSASSWPAVLGALSSMRLASPAALIWAKLRKRPRSIPIASDRHVDDGLTTGGETLGVASSPIGPATTVESSDVPRVCVCQ